MTDISPYADAKARGLKFYFTGKPCVHGHIAERYTSSMACLTCSQGTKRKYKRPKGVRPYITRGVREAAKAAGLTHYDGSPCKRCGSTQKHTSNGACVACSIDNTRKYYAADAEKYRERARRHMKAHPWVRRAAVAKRRAALRQAKCDCCTSADIHRVYKAAIAAGCEVDHVIELADGGKHCAKNLRALPPHIHLIKTSAMKSVRALRKRMKAREAQIGNITV